MGTYYDPVWIAGAFLGFRRGAAAKIRAMSTGFDGGMTLVDTAEIYQSEPLVSSAMMGRRRDEIFLATKVWSSHLHRDDLVRAFEKSLRRLGTSYIDLYQVHWPNPSVPIQETMSAMQDLIDQGKLMNPGVSNFNLQQLEEAHSALPRSELSSVQLDYSLIHRNVERDIVPYCDKEGIALLAYYPLGHGRLASNPRVRLSDGREKTSAQVALQWLASKPGVFPIPRASNEAHVRENIGASDWELSDQDKMELERKFP